MSHTPSPHSHSLSASQQQQHRSTPSRSAAAADPASELTSRMAAMAMDQQAHDGYGAALRHQQQHQQGAFTTPPAPGAGAGYVYHPEYSPQYWAPAPASNAGSAPPSAGPHMGVFNVPYTPTEASPITATFNYNDQHYEAYGPAPPQHEMYQDRFGTTPPAPRRRGGPEQQQDQHGVGWSPNAHVGGGRLSDPNTAPYYGLSGPGYAMPHTPYLGSRDDVQGPRRRQNRDGNGYNNQNGQTRNGTGGGGAAGGAGGRGYRNQNSQPPMTPLMSPISIVSQHTGNGGFQQAPMHLPIQYGLHPNYVPQGGGSGYDGARGWRSLNPYNRREHQPRSPLLDEFRMNKSGRWTLADIAGSMVEFSGDQHGSRFIQQRLEMGTDEDRRSVLAELEPNILALMMDVFGNYVVQKLFEVCDQGQKAHLASKMEGNLVQLSLEMYGCRVVQKAFEHILKAQRDKLVEELRGRVLDCVKDSNGNHVVQRLITLDGCPKFVHQAFEGHVHELACHPYGCRVLQKTFEVLDVEHVQLLLEEMHPDILKYTNDQYGNYVVQSILTSTPDEHRRRVTRAYMGNIQSLARHKFASNVIEKTLKQASDDEKEVLIEELIGEHENGTDQVKSLLRDLYGNFPVQTALSVAQGQQRDKLLGCILAAMPDIKHTPVGKRLDTRLTEMGVDPDGPVPVGDSTPPLTSPSGSGAETIRSESTGITSPENVLAKTRSRSIAAMDRSAAGTPTSKSSAGVNQSQSQSLGDQQGKGKQKIGVNAGVRYEQALEDLLQ